MRSSQEIEAAERLVIEANIDELVRQDLWSSDYSQSARKALSRASAARIAAVRALIALRERESK